MSENMENEFAQEVSSRLGEFFGDEAGSDHQPEDSTASAFTELQAIVLSIEWEITDQIMGRLINETEKLKNLYQDNKNILAFLKLLGSVGKYINRKKAGSHPESITFFHSVHNSLQKVVASATITKAETEKILSVEISKFKNLKQQLLTNARPPGKKEKMPSMKTAPVTGEQEMAFKGTEALKVSDRKADDRKVSPEPEVRPGSPSSDAFIAAVEEIKQVIRDEFKKLREELKMPQS